MSLRWFLFLGVACLTMPAMSASAADFSARLTDAEWDGKIVPKDHVCKLGGAVRPMSPRIEVTNLPAGTTKIIVAFNDESYPRLATDGGHGKISVEVGAGAKSVMVPSVPSEDETVPGSVRIEAKHRSTTPGYYLAPCSRGTGHVYAAEITAVKSGWLGRSNLDRLRLPLGVY